MANVIDGSAPSIPPQSYWALWWRFLRFGALAWGGPVAQIAMIKRELVEEERWIPVERFNRALAVYQVLPGPEAHELCVYFGMLARGRLGGLIAGAGFMLPGFVLMFALSWLYVSQGPMSPGFAAVFAALQAAVLALIFRAGHRIGKHALHDRVLLAIGLASLVAGVIGVHFAVGLVSGGAAYALYRSGRKRLATAAALLWIAACVGWLYLARNEEAAPAVASVTAAVSTPNLFWSGLRSGMLTFGGAYTVIPFLQDDAVVRGAWMTNSQFLDGVALSGILPAPLIIFATFVGFVGGGVLGALALTTGIFLPAFGFTLLAHDALERLTEEPRVRSFLDGVTASVVGLIGSTIITLAPPVLEAPRSILVFILALVVLYVVQHRLVTLIVMGGAALAGILFF